jgi:hypothetical protein
MPEKSPKLTNATGPPPPPMRLGTGALALVAAFFWLLELFMQAKGRRC